LRAIYDCFVLCRGLLLHNLCVLQFVPGFRALRPDAVDQGSVTKLGGQPAYAFASDAFSINNKSQLVGGSGIGCVLFYSGRALLWQNGAMIDLNSLIPPNARLSPHESWGKPLGDSAAVTAMLDRLLHHGHILKCGPRNWRTKIGLPPQQAAG
jgi:hypothetical protein